MKARDKWQCSVQMSSVIFFLSTCWKINDKMVLFLQSMVQNTGKHLVEGVHQDSNTRVEVHGGHVKGTCLYTFLISPCVHAEELMQHVYLCYSAGNSWRCWFLLDTLPPWWSIIPITALALTSSVRLPPLSPHVAVPAAPRSWKTRPLIHLIQWPRGSWSSSNTWAKPCCHWCLGFCVWILWKQHWSLLPAQGTRTLLIGLMERGRACFMCLLHHWNIKFWSFQAFLNRSFSKLENCANAQREEMQGVSFQLTGWGF